MFAVSREQVSFFKKNLYISFEGLFLPTSCKELKHLLEKSLAERLDTPASRLEQKPNIDLFTSSYDLHLVDDKIRKFSHKPKLSNLAQNLFDTSLIRFGFSQYLMTTSDPTPPFKENLPFSTSCCLSPLLGLLLINLSEVHGLLAPFSLPQQPGSALFLSPAFPFPWKEIFSMPHSHFFLVGFADNKTFFRAETPDPLAYELKKLGYAFNDLLHEPLHPLLHTPF